MKETSFVLKLFGIKIISVKISTETKAQTDTINTQTYSAPQNSINAGNIRPDLKELEKEVFKIEDQPDPIKVTCVTCGGVTYDDDIDVCIKCNTVICSNCGSVVTEGGIAKCYCEQCWKEV